MLGLAVVFVAAVLWLCLVVAVIRRQRRLFRDHRAARDEYDRTHNLDSVGFR